MWWHLQRRLPLYDIALLEAVWVVGCKNSYDEARQFVAALKMLNVTKVAVVGEKSHLPRVLLALHLLNPTLTPGRLYLIRIKIIIKHINLYWLYYYN